MARASMTLAPEVLCAAHSPLHVARGCVHVWSFELQASPGCLTQCRNALCPAEAARAARFIGPASRDDFVIAHGVLRHLLARYTGAKPVDLRFSSGPNGKPALCPPRAREAVSFNLTHSHGRALIAVSDGREIGIDLERIKADVNALAIAQRYFARSECAAIQAAPLNAQAQAFYGYWVAKEALLKGEGTGLRLPIDEFAVQFDESHTAARVVSESARLASDWTLQMLPLQPGWVGALAVRGQDWRLQMQSSAEPPGLSGESGVRANS